MSKQNVVWYKTPHIIAFNKAIRYFFKKHAGSRPKFSGLVHYTRWLIETESSETDKIVGCDGERGFEEWCCLEIEGSYFHVIGVNKLDLTPDKKGTLHEYIVSNKIIFNPAHCIIAGVSDTVSKEFREMLFEPEAYVRQYCIE